MTKGCETCTYKELKDGQGTWGSSEPFSCSFCKWDREIELKDNYIPMYDESQEETK